MKRESLSLDALWQDPALGDQLPAAEIPLLLCRIASLQAVLLSRLAVGAGASEREVEFDQLFSLEDACALLKIQPDYLYRHWKKIPGAMKIAGKIRFTSDGLKRWTETQRSR